MDLTDSSVYDGGIPEKGPSMNSKPLPKIQSFLKELKRNQPAGKKQTLQEWSMAGGGVPTQYKGREHVWHAKVNKFAAGGEVKMAGGGDPRGEMKAYDPTIRERMADALQRGIEGLGGNRYKARQNAQTLMGGPSSNLPINLGIADVVPFLGTALGVDEGARDLGYAYDAVKRGDYVDAAANTVGAAAGLIPGAAGTIKGAKAVGRGALDLAKSDAAYNLSQKALASPALAAARPMNVVKPTGGNFLTGRTEKDLTPLKTRTIAGETPAQRIPKHEELLKDPSLNQDQLDRVRYQLDVAKGEAALDKWVDSNLTNYVKKQMGTPDDPVRKLAEQGITHKPGLLDDYRHTEEALKKQRTEAGFPEEGMGQSPTAQAWERASDDAISTHRAGDIQAMPEKFTKSEEAKVWMVAARDELDKKFMKHLENSGLNDREVASLMGGTSYIDKARIVGDTAFSQANADYLIHHSPMMESYMTFGRENPWISKVAPETQVYRPFTGDLGFDHIMDVLREDVTAGRIRPDQLNKVSMEQAVRRTYEYDQELAAKMNASRAAAREGLPTYKEYPEGYKWIELNKPGSFAQESEAMGHSVRGYEPPKGHPDWTEASGDAGSSGYGHGGWEAIKSGKAKVYSLVDSKGAPHATVEVARGEHPIGYSWKGASDQFPNAFEYNRNFDERFPRLTPEQNQTILSRAKELHSKDPKRERMEAFQFAADEVLGSLPAKISQIKGKQNRAPNEEYLPYIQDFVKGGKWSDVGDLSNTRLRDLQRTPKLDEYLKQKGVEVPRYLDEGEYQKYESDFLMDQLYPKNDPQYLPPQTPEGMAHGGAVHMAGGGAAKKVVEGAFKGVKKLLGMADEVPKGVEPIVVKQKVDHPLVFPRATPKTKEDIRPIAQRMAEQVTGDFVRQNPKLTTNPAGKSRKQYNREQEIPLETRRLTEEKPVPFVDYASKKGSILLGVPGDPTLGGLARRGSLEESAKPTVELTRVGDITPDSPVPLFGGPRYGDEEKFWASNYGAALPIQNNATELAKLYEAPVLGQYIKMAPGSENFAIHNLDALLAIQQPEKLSKSNLRSLNSLIKQGSLKYGKFPGFAGFDDPIHVLLQAQLNPKLRKHIAETLTKPTITDSLGLSSGLDVVAAITHPQLRNLETGASGFSIGEMRPGSDLRQFRGAHPTYDTDIPGAAIGQSRYPIPAELAFPDTTAYARSQMTPGVQEFNMIKLLGPRERIDQQYIDEIKMYEELMKQYTGKKKGGAISKPKHQNRSVSTTD
jgi:hypothetical protein